MFNGGHTMRTTDRRTLSGPKVFLVVDNCFASKRWTEPLEWMELIREMGVFCVEASADTEADPMYCGEQYMADWVEDVLRAEQRTGAKVVNLYSGHGTYATLGLGHSDSRVRRRMVDRWLKPMVRAAVKLGCGLGFYCHAFPDRVLQDPNKYANALDGIYQQLSELARYASTQGLSSISVEQMYSPQQIPWTIAGARELLCEVYRRGSTPVYVTIDTGHQTGQHKFLRPTLPLVAQAAVRTVRTGEPSNLWLGPRSAAERFEACLRKRRMVSDREIRKIVNLLEAYPHLFSSEEDSDTYAWIRSLGCYSPIMHLQQVTSDHSAHLPFTEHTNRQGSIKAQRVLNALAQAYRQPTCDQFPPRCPNVYLTLEIFAGPAETSLEIVRKIRASVQYWRSFIPRDGMMMGELLGGSEQCTNGPP
jgi:sugar phosphate isomerase/epimerase